MAALCRKPTSLAGCASGGIHRRDAADAGTAPPFITRRGFKQEEKSAGPKWIADNLAAADAESPCQRMLLRLPSFGFLNYAVLFVASGCSPSASGPAGKRSAASYFTGEGRVHHVLVGLSLLGTYLSALTMMALPKMSYGPDNWTWTVQLPFLLITAVVITGVVMPRYREAGCISVYEFLERRIHVSSRLIASIAFILLSIGRMGLVLYLPSLALSWVLGVDLRATIMVMGVVVAVYRVQGHSRGDLDRRDSVVIFIVGALATLLCSLPASTFAVARRRSKFKRSFWTRTSPASPPTG